MRPHKHWTLEEEELLRVMYPSEPIEVLEDTFDTTWSLIKSKARRLPVSRDKKEYPEEEILAEYKLGTSPHDIKKKFNIGLGILYDIVHDHKVELNKKFIVRPADTVEFAKDYLTCCNTDVCNKYSMSPWGVKTLAKELKLEKPENLKHKTTSFLSEEQKGIIEFEYVTNNKTIAQIAVQINLNASVIYSYTRKQPWSRSIEKLMVMRQNTKNEHGFTAGFYGKAENEIKLWLEANTHLTFTSDHTILDGKEIDIYNEETKIGVEYCGLHWHNEGSPAPRGMNYHYDKYKTCKEKGIHLVTIFEDEWNNRQEQVKGALLSIFGKNTRKLYARKCTIKSIDKAIGNKFYDQYHIQGATKLGLYFAGLYFEDELVGVMSFGLHPRDTTKHVLDRLCFKSGVSIAGGASRLFKFLVNESKVETLISWSDNRWFQGKVYEKLGFKLGEELKPDYSYTRNNDPRRYSKQSQKKTNTDCPVDMTEKEWAEKRGLYRIWDCGKLRWEWNKV